jgi:hypothetical protein
MHAKRRRETAMPHRVDEGLVNTLKRVASVLKQAEVPFALGGSFAVYAHGGHSSDHDVDFLIREQDKARALESWPRSASRCRSRPRTGWSRSSTRAGWWT